MKWLKVWKKSSRSSDSGHYYFYVSDDFANDDDECKYLAEEWAEQQSYGSYYGYSYGWEIVEKPDKEWLEEEIRITKRNIAADKIYLEQLYSLNR